MDFSPEWPKGGLPISCANEAEATIAPKSFDWYPNLFFKCGYFFKISTPTFLPSDLPTTLVSKL